MFSLEYGTQIDIQCWFVDFSGLHFHITNLTWKGATSLNIVSLCSYENGRQEYILYLKHNGNRS